MKFFMLSFLFCGSAIASVNSGSWGFNTGREHTGTQKKNISLYTQIVFSEDYGFEERWATVSKLAKELKSKEKMVFLRKCLKRDEWFLKSPALKIMRREDQREALLWAKKLLREDKALVVRSDAVAIIQQLQDDSSVTLLWDQLYSPKNFKGSASLWIRPQIVKALRKLEKAPKKSKWRTLLSDSDRKVQQEAKKQIREANFL